MANTEVYFVLASLSRRNGSSNHNRRHASCGTPADIDRGARQKKPNEFFAVKKCRYFALFNFYSAITTID
jgi:hypothetical protein